MRAIVIGCGHAGKKHIKAYEKIHGANIRYIYDENRSQTYRTGYGGPHYFFGSSMASFKSVEENVDVVSLCTPSHIRAEYFGAITKYKKHVLVEKPLALSVKEAETIIRACSVNNLILGVVMQKRFNPNIQKLCGEVRAQTFGKPLIASQVVRWYRPTSYYQGWKGEIDKGGSILINQAIHHIDLLQWILGPVRSVFGYAETLGHKINTTDAVVATLKFESGAIGTLEASTVAYPKNAGENLTILSEWGRRTIDTAWPHHEPIIRNFVECVRENREPMVTGEESLKSLKIALAIQESADTGKEVFVQK